MTDPKKKPISATITEAGVVELAESELEQASGGVKFGDITLKRGLITEVGFPALDAAVIKAGDGSV